MRIKGTRIFAKKPSYRDRIFQQLDWDPDLSIQQLMEITGACESTVRTYYSAWHGPAYDRPHTGSEHPDHDFICDMIKEAVELWTKRIPCTKDTCKWSEDLAWDEEKQANVKVRYLLHNCAPWAALWLSSRTCEDLCDTLNVVDWEKMLTQLGIQIPPEHLRAD